MAPWELLTRAVVNFSDLAGQEATITRARKEQPAPHFVPIPHDLSVPTMSEMPNGTEQPDVDTPAGDLEDESSANEEALQRAPEI